ncbi:MAG: hypothetical protein WC867_07555 [Candidatus Pacearchaeota archaeon]|jgi:hypothetical protein
MNKLGLVSAIVLTLIGAILMILPFFINDKLSFFTWIYGIPLFIIGIVIFFNLDKEDKIEQIKYRK